MPKQIGGSLSSWMQDNEGRVRIPSCDTSIKSRVISDNDTSLSGELKAFHTCFEQTNKVSHCHVTPFSADSVTHISVAEVRYVIMTVNFQKVVSVDVVPGQVLKLRANQLATFFVDISNCSLQQSTVPICFKKTFIILVQGKNYVICLNDNHPVALTLTIMKCFGRLTMVHIKVS